MLRSTGLRAFAAAALLLTSVSPVVVSQTEARGGDRTLRLYYTHTKERGDFTFKKNGRYDRAVLDKLNRFLRDWRQNEPTRMDPQLFDLVWAIQQQAGSDQPIHIVSSYRSLKTNNMLRTRSRGVAQKSQHTAGKAMDFFIPGVPLSKLRAIALKMQVGGVGYYPGSGSPFIHVDTGSVRMWPRMTRQQLAQIFPNGETLYLPADGKPLPGFERAQAKFGGRSKETQMAALDANTRSSGRGKNANVGSWLKRVFTQSQDEVDENEMTGQAPAPAAPAPARAPAAETLVAAAERTAPAPLPRSKPLVEAPAAMMASAPAVPVKEATEVAIASMGMAPLPRIRPGETMMLASATPATDAIANLQARMGANTSDGTEAAVDAASRLGGAAPVGVPAPRPAVQMAYADPSLQATYETAYGGRYARVPAPRPGSLPIPEQDRVGLAALADQVQAEAPEGPAAEESEMASLRVEQAVEVSAEAESAATRQLMSQLTARSRAFAQMHQPEPNKGDVLFTGPDAGTSQGFSKVAAIPSDRFAAPAAPVAASAAAEPTLLQRLFARF